MIQRNSRPALFHQIFWGHKRIIGAARSSFFRISHTYCFILNADKSRDTWVENLGQIADFSPSPRKIMRGMGEVTGFKHILRLNFWWTFVEKPLRGVGDSTFSLPTFFGGRQFCTVFYFGGVDAPVEG